MLVSLPHVTLTEYLRDFTDGALGKFCAIDCPSCKSPVKPIPQRRRKFLDIPVFRARCSNENCKIYFTFLPVFVPPGKWYDYEAIERALGFVAQSCSSTSSALEELDHRRDERLLQHESPGPSSSTIRRWHSELTQSRLDQPWFERAEEAVLSLQGQIWPGLLPRCGPDGFPGEKPFSAPRVDASKPKSCHPCPDDAVRKSFSRSLLCFLLTLGDCLLGPSPWASPSRLGVGLWYLECRCGRRCLAGVHLSGRLIPGPAPNLAETWLHQWAYPPVQP